MFKNQYFVSDYYKRILEDIKRDILTKDDNYITQSDIEKLIEGYYTCYSLDPIKFDETRRETFQHKKELRTVPAHKREEFHRNLGDIQFEFETIIVKMPIIPNEKLDTILSLQSSLFSLSGKPKVNCAQDTISFNLDIKGYGFEYNENQIATIINKKKDEIYEWIRRKNDDILKENKILKSEIRIFIETRKQKLAEDNKKMKRLMQTMNMPLRNEENELKRRIKLSPKPLIRKIKVAPSRKIEYELDKDLVMNIISFIDNQGRQFESTPATFKIFKEEDFRNTLLVNLNSIFEGKATGETFCKKGKTDIYLNMDKGRILIFECKIWAGKSKYNKAIDQLQRYLTWRSNFGIIITFVKRKNFSNVLKTIEDLTKEHPTFKSSFKILSETHFESMHTHEEDIYKIVEIHHLFYNLHVEKT